MFIKWIELKSIFHVHAFIHLWKRKSFKRWAPSLKCSAVFSYVSLVIFNGRDTTQDFLFPVENNFKAFTPAVYFLPHPESPVFVNQTLFSGAAWQWDLHPVATLPWTLMMEVTELYLVMHLHSNEKIQTFFISFYFTPLLIKKRGQYLCIHQCSQYYLTTAVS